MEVVMVKLKLNGWKKDAVLVIMLAVFCVFFISNFGIGGKIGNGISSFSFGMIGIISYVTPLLFIFLALYLTSNREHKISRLKGIAIILILVIATTFGELLVHANEPLTIKSAYIYSYQMKEGGGILGAVFANLFVYAFGVIGAYVVSIAGIIISILLFTKKALVSILRRKRIRFSDEQSEQTEQTEPKSVDHEIKQ